DDIVSRIGLGLDIGKPPFTRVNRDKHLSGSPAKLVIVFMLDAALPTVLHPHGPEHLRRQISRGVKALWFLLQVNALQSQRTDALDGLVVRLASDPAEGLVSAEIGRAHV